MQPIKSPGYELCYLDARQSVSVISSDRAAGIAASGIRLPWWDRWGRSAFAVVVVLGLVALGVANIALHGRWHEVEDGVLWAARAEGVVAREVAPGSAAAAAGVERGDVLLAV